MNTPPDATAAQRARAEAARRNKKLIEEYYELALNRLDFAAARAYIGPYYRQHSTYGADGPEGLERFIEWARAELPGFHVDFVRMIADGDYVLMHNRGRNSPGTKAVVDIFRIENGKVVEHWDVLQDVPETSKNANTMF
ncbi:MAG TPA: nuclear transport factor 2 family protein [Steroidobacteraceae bacterium]|nr:nuclear transport factor 2 family protein [Steroidobacteraceae bacterium]